MHRQIVHRRMQTSVAALARRPALQKPSSRAFSATTAASSNVIYDVYKQRVNNGEISYDPVQVRSVKHLDVLYDQLLQYGEPPARKSKSAVAASSSSWWQRLTGDSEEKKPEQATAAGDKPVPKGLYLHGGVGCGKVRTSPWLWEMALMS
jgi:predicted ATPase